MKKQIISLAIAAIALTSFTSFAQTKGAAAPCCTATPTGVCTAANRPAPGPKAMNPFEGINLTADQKSKLESLAQERRKDIKARGDEQKKMRRERFQADSARMVASREARKADRKAYLAKVKSILTPGQYVTYLENMATEGRMGHRPHASAAGKGRDRNGKHHGARRHGRNAGQCQTPACAAAPQAKS